MVRLGSQSKNGNVSDISRDATSSKGEDRRGNLDHFA